MDPLALSPATTAPHYPLPASIPRALHRRIPPACSPSPDPTLRTASPTPTPQPNLSTCSPTPDPYLLRRGIMAALSPPPASPPRPHAKSRSQVIFLPHRPDHVYVPPRSPTTADPSPPSMVLCHGSSPETSSPLILCLPQPVNTIFVGRLPLRRGMLHRRRHEVTVQRQCW